jgi:hypothetical protein
MDTGIKDRIFEESALVSGICNRLFLIVVDFSLATSLAGDHTEFRDV